MGIYPSSPPPSPWGVSWAAARGHGRPSAATAARLDAAAATVRAHLSRWASPPLSNSPLVGIDAAARGTAVGLEVPPVRPPTHRPTGWGGPPLVGAGGRGAGPAASAEAAAAATAAAAAAAAAAARHRRGSGETVTRHLALLVPEWTPASAPALRVALWRALNGGGDASLTPAGTEAAAADPAASADEVTVDVGGVLVGIVVGGGSLRGVAGLLGRGRGGGGLAPPRSTAAGGRFAWAAAARTSFMAAQGGLFPDMARLAKLWVESVAWPDEEEVVAATGGGGASPPPVRSPPWAAKPSPLLVELVMLAAYHDDAGELADGGQEAWDRSSAVSAAAGGTAAAAAGPPRQPSLPPPDVLSPPPPPAGRWRALPFLGLGSRGGSPWGARATGGRGAEGEGQSSEATGAPRRRRLARWRRAASGGSPKPAPAWDPSALRTEAGRLGWDLPGEQPYWPHLVRGGGGGGRGGPFNGDCQPQLPAVVAPSAESLADFLGDDRVGGRSPPRGSGGGGGGGGDAKGSNAPHGVGGASGVRGGDALAVADLAAVWSGRLSVAAASEPPAAEATPVGLDHTCARIFLRFLTLLSGDATDPDIPGGGGGGGGGGGSGLRIIGWDALYSASVAMATAPPVPLEDRPLMVLDPALPSVDVAAQVTDWEPLRAAARRTAAILLSGRASAGSGRHDVTTTTAATAAATISYPTVDHRRGGLPWGNTPVAAARGWHPGGRRTATPPRDPHGIASLVSALQVLSPPAWCQALDGGSGDDARGGDGAGAGAGGRGRDDGRWVGTLLGTTDSPAYDGGASSLSDALPLPRVLSVLSDSGPDADAAAAAAAATRGGGTRGAAGGLATSMAGDSFSNHHCHSPAAGAPPPTPPPGYSHPRVVIATAAVPASVAAAASAEWTPVGGEVAFQGGGWRLWVRRTGGGGPPLPPLGTGSFPGRGGGGSGDSGSLLSRQSSSVRRRLRAAVGAVGGGGGGGDPPASKGLAGSPGSSSGRGGGAATAAAAALPSVMAADGGGVGGGGGGGGGIGGGGSTGAGGGGASGGGRATKPVPYTFTRLDVAVERLGGDASGASGWLVMDARLAGVETATLAWGGGRAAQVLVGGVEAALPTVFEVVFSLL